jgi:hypothetical protein
MKRLYFLIVVLQVVTITLKAQQFHDQKPVTWGKISETEKNIQTFNGRQVPAIVLCDYGETLVFNRTVYKRHKRIKVVSEEGMHYNVINIEYNPHNVHDDILSIQGQTINFEENGQMTVSKLRNRHIKDIHLSKDKAIRRLKFPDVRPGSIIEFKYEISSMDIQSLDDWYFQNEIPTLWSEYRLEVPDPFVYLMTYQEGAPLHVNEANAFAKNLSWFMNVNERSWQKRLSNHNNLLYNAEQTNYTVHVVHNKVKKIVKKDIEGYGFVEEPMSLKQNYAAKLKFQLYKFSGNLPHYFKPRILTVEKDKTPSRMEVFHETYPAGYVHYMLDTWDEMTYDYLDDSNLGAKLNEDFNFVPILEEAINPDASPYEKMKGIYLFVRNYFDWNEDYEVFSDDSFHAIFKNRSGSSADINLFMIYLLKRAGLQTDILLTKTIDQGWVELVYPEYRQFNHIIARISINNQVYYLDGTLKEHKELGYQSYADYLNAESWILNRKNYGWDNLY